MRGVSLGKQCRFFGMPSIYRFRGSRIEIGPGVEMRSSRKSNVLGLAHSVILTTLARDAVIEIGEGVGLSGTTICAARRITVGAFSIVGADTLITDTDHHAIAGDRYRYSDEGVQTAPVHIGNNVFIGARSIILKGTRIDDNAVVGAGAVVSGHVPEGAIVAGNPARSMGNIADTDRTKGRA